MNGWLDGWMNNMVLCLFCKFFQYTVPAFIYIFFSTHRKSLGDGDDFHWFADKEAQKPRLSEGERFVQDLSAGK